MSAAAEAHVLAPAPEAASSGRSPTRRWEARRRAILASAVEELNRNGVRGMTLGDVAARLDLVPTAVVYYFRNKDDLAQACLLAAIERLDDLLAEARAGGSPGARLDRFVRSFCDFKRDAAEGRTGEIAALVDLRALASPALDRAHGNLLRRARELLDPSTIYRPQAPGDARALLLLSHIAGAAEWLKRWEAADYGRAAARLAAILRDGLATPEAARLRPTPAYLSLEADADWGPPAMFIGAATELINAEGYHGASVERIASRLNVSKGAFYHHNDSKDALVLACFERTFQAMHAAFCAAEAVAGSGLEALAWASATLAQRQLERTTALARTSALATAPDAIRPQLMAGYDRLSQRIASMLCDGIADGSVRAVDVNIAAQTILATISAATDLPDFAPGLDPAAIVELYVRPLFKGLLSSPEV